MSTFVDRKPYVISAILFIDHTYRLYFMKTSILYKYVAYDYSILCIIHTNYKCHLQIEKESKASEGVGVGYELGHVCGLRTRSPVKVGDTRPDAQ